jgi:homoserine dehydrogenase
MRKSDTVIEYRPLRIALLGAGSVGAQVARLLTENKAELAARVGAELELIGIAVRDLKAGRAEGFPTELLTTDAEALILGADIVIEVMGGIEPARTYILQALNSGSDVITANKALLATHGTELFDTAEQVGAQLYFEAAVAAAIPIIRPLRESLAGDKVQRVMGIVNGSTNYILDRMDSAGITLEEAMAEATELGYLEADPTLDVEGYDAAQKAAILAYLAFHTEVPIEKVHREGITGVTPELMRAAQRDGNVIKLLAIAERIDADKSGEEGVSVRVYPTLIPRTHPLGAVRGAFNAVFIEAESAGQLMFYGAGAVEHKPHLQFLVTWLARQSVTLPVARALQIRCTLTCLCCRSTAFTLATKLRSRPPTSLEFSQPSQTRLRVTKFQSSSSSRHLPPAAKLRTSKSEPTRQPMQLFRPSLQHSLQAMRSSQLLQSFE